MNLIKLTHVNRGETRRAWINKDKIIYMQPINGDSDDLAKTVMLVQDVGTPFSIAETCDDILVKIELANKKET